jgi:LysR family transcriptional regulator, glycine cleavage system transcriptional activator
MQFRDLPPLHFLPAFEAAGRLGSFKAAAAELRLTPPAISQQLKAIEDALGVALFERRGRTVRLTAAGETYLRDVQQLLSEAATATRRVRERSTQRVLRVSMPDFVAYDFMLARLSQFRAAFPGIELSVEASPRVVDFATCDIDAAFRVAEGSWPNLVAHVVGDAHIALVCAPELARQIRTISQLRHHSLIELRGQERRGWRAFMKRHGLPEPEQLLCFDGYLEVLRAAEQGLGVAFGIFPMATPWVTSGRLAVPLPFRVPFAGKVSFVYRKAEARDPLFSELATWLRQQYAELPALPAGRVLRRSRLRSDKLSSRSAPR